MENSISKTHHVFKENVGKLKRGGSKDISEKATIHFLPAHAVVNISNRVLWFPRPTEGKHTCFNFKGTATIFQGRFNIEEARWKLIAKRTIRNNYAFLLNIQAP